MRSERARTNPAVQAELESGTRKAVGTSGPEKKAQERQADYGSPDKHGGKKEPEVVRAAARGGAGSAGARGSGESGRHGTVKKRNRPRGEDGNGGEGTEGQGRKPGAAERNAPSGVGAGAHFGRSSKRSRRQAVPDCTRSDRGLPAAGFPAESGKETAGSVAPESRGGHAAGRLRTRRWSRSRPRRARFRTVPPFPPTRRARSGLPRAGRFARREPLRTARTRGSPE